MIPIRNYTVSQDKNTGLWYCHMKGFPYIPCFGSFCETKSDAMEYAKMYNGLKHNVDRLERKKEVIPISRPEEKWKPKKVLFEDIGYDPFHDVNVYACICPDCGLHIFEFTDDDVDDKCDSDNPEVMFKSSMVHHGYMGLNNFCNCCGRKLDWGDYNKQHKKEHRQSQGD